MRTRFPPFVPQSAILRLLSACGQVGTDRPPLQRHAKHVITTWVVAVVVVIVLLDVTHGWFAIPASLALVGYGGYWLRSGRRGLLVGRPATQTTAQFGAPALRFNPPPGWPVPRLGWAPPPGWLPGPSWPQPPPGWQFWVLDGQAPVGERNTRSIPQDVKIAVAARDGCRCRQCGSTTELHFDHVIPWSKGWCQYRGEHPVALRPV